MLDIDVKFFNIETILIQTILLLVIIYVLNKFVFKPYLAYLDEELEKKKKLEEDYKNIDKLIKKAEEDKESLLKEARAKADGIVSDAETLAKKKASDIVSKAENDAKNMLDSANKDIEKERLSMMSGVKSNLVSIALKINEKLFKNEKVSSDFVEKEIDLINK